MRPLQQELAAALREGSLSVVFLPIIRLPDRHPVCLETLLRWAHPREGPIGPARILAAAAGTPLIHAIAPVVLAAALRMAQHSPAELQVSVNACAAEVAAAEFLDSLRAALAAAGVAPERLLIEVDPATATGAGPFCRALATLDVRLVIDGLRLSDWPIVDHLRPCPSGVKVHPDLVGAIGLDRAAEEEVRAIVRRGAEGGVQVSAERVETESQASFLVGTGCHLAQGWLFGPPRPDPFCARTNPPR